jgi:acetylglutamate kinase
MPSGLSGEDGALFSAMQRKPIIDGTATDIGLVGDVVSGRCLRGGRHHQRRTHPRGVIRCTERGRCHAGCSTSTADSAAAALAAALGARKFLILTDVDGLYADWPDKNSLIGRIGVRISGICCLTWNPG